MPNKPRPLGNVARQTVEAADIELASAFCKLRELLDKPDLLILERKYIAREVQVEISEARRLLSSALSLRE
jgi:hypothetical protein